MSGDLCGILLVYVYGVGKEGCKFSWVWGCVCDG